ncbi:MAG: hypothetical protein AMXMBFR13_07180 [Phycisphaerae bacterium]
MCLVTAVSASGAITIPGADGSDGALNPVANVEVDLSAAPAAAWDGVNPNPGQNKGVYDATKWAVVFRYTEVNIPAGVTVTFKNRDGRPPVVWLVSGNVSIAGTVNLNGQNGDNGLAREAEPGPGGFRGGRGTPVGGPGGAGYGPGGASYMWGSIVGAGGSYGALGGFYTVNHPQPGPVYGHPSVVPLMGGSGGSGEGDEFRGGGAGGGAILMGAGGVFSIAATGTVTCRGGSGSGAWGGGGSGGAIRVLADSIEGTGALTATGGSSNASGGSGRIRLEANTISFSGSNAPAYISATPGILWPAVGAPTVRIVSVGGEAVDSDPKAQFGPTPDASVSGLNPVLVLIETTNLPPTSTVTLRVVPREGNDIRNIPAVYNGTSGLWEASIDLASGYSTLQVRAVKP